MKLAGAYINDEKYERLVALAESNNRTLAGQCRHLFDRALSGELQVPQCTTPVAGAGGVRATAAAAKRAGKVPGLLLAAAKPPGAVTMPAAGAMAGANMGAITKPAEAGMKPATAAAWAVAEVKEGAL